MNEKIKGLLKNKNNLIVIVLVGVLLMVITLPVEEKQDSTSHNKLLQTNDNGSYLNVAGEKSQNTDAAMTGIDDVAYDTTNGTGQDYARQMEEKLEEVLEKMEGAGEVQVFITLSSSEELIVEKDAPVNRSNTAEADAEGGSRTINSVDAGENTVYATEGNISMPYVVKTVTPRVEGVLVLAQGAGNGTVNKNIADAVQVLFGIEAHQVKVIKMEVTNIAE